MTTKKVEIEVELPDCDLCGKCIYIGDQYINLRIDASRYNKHVGSSSGKSIGYKEIIICKRCAMLDTGNVSLKQYVDTVFKDMFAKADWY